MANDALIDCFARHELEVAALYRGIEGFGIGRRIHTDRFPDVSTDLPLIAEAIDTRERIEAVLPDVDAIIDKGLVTIEHSLVAVGDDVRNAEFPDGAGSAGRLTVYCGRGERSAGRAAYRAVVELLRRQGASGATVLLGVDGIHNGQRQRAGLLSRNANVPVATIAVGPTHVLQRVLLALPDVLARPVANLERIAVVKHDGELLEPLPLITDSGDGDPPVWMALRVYTRQSAQTKGGAIYTVLTRRLRQAGAAGITTLRGEWGFSSDERPFGDRFGTLASHVPTYTIFVDRPSKIAELWPIVDEITAQHGVVTAALVPAYRERAGEVDNGRLTVGSSADIAELYRTRAAPQTAHGPTVATRIPTERDDRRGRLGTHARRRNRRVRRYPQPPTAARPRHARRRRAVLPGLSGAAARRRLRHAQPPPPAGRRPRRRNRRRRHGATRCRRPAVEHPQDRTAHPRPARHTIRRRLPPAARRPLTHGRP